MRSSGSSWLAGPALNARAYLGQTPLQSAVDCLSGEHRHGSADAAGTLRAVRVLLEHKPDVDARDGDGQTALDLSENSQLRGLLSQHGARHGARRGM